MKTKAGSVTRRCYCRDENGKTLGKACPKLSRKNHGVRSIRQELSAAADGSRRVFRRSGYDTVEDAQTDLDLVRTLLGLPDTDEEADQLAELLASVGQRGDTLPKIEDVQRQLHRGQPLGSKLTVSEWLNQWLATKQHRPATALSYESHIRLYLNPHIGSVPLDRLQVRHLSAMFQAIAEEADVTAANNADRKAFEAELRETKDHATRQQLRRQLEALAPYRRPVGPSSRQRVRATLRAALNDAIAEQLISFNPASHIKLSAGRPRPMVWTEERVEEWRRTGQRPSSVMVWRPDQTGIFLDHVHDDPLYALWILCAFRGLRRGEVCGLRWIDIDLDAEAIHVSRKLTEVDYEVNESEPKSEAGTRTVALDNVSAVALHEHRRKQLKERMSWGAGWIETGRVFVHENGEQLRPSKVTEHFAKLISEADLPPIRLHDLRHGAATLALAAGVDMRTVQETLGHSSINVTADTYSTVLPEVARKAADATADLVPRGSGTNGHASGTQTG